MKSQYIWITFFFYIMCYAPECYSEKKVLSVPVDCKISANRIFDFNPDSFLGDGLTCYIHKLKKVDVSNLIITFKMDSSWKKGPLSKHIEYRGIIPFFKQWIDVHMNDKQKQSFNILINLKEIINTDNTIFKVKLEKNERGFITNATLWMLIPEKQLFIILRENT